MSADRREQESELQRDRIRVLYSFPHKLGAERICTTAWYQVDGAASEGADITLCPGAITRRVRPGIRVLPTLARGPLRIPYRVLGDMRAFALHDHIVAHRLERFASQIDIVHVWPLAALKTLRTAARLGVPSVLERPNAHTRVAYEVVRAECDRLGVMLPPQHEHAYKQDVLDKEEAEYQLATKLLCPSDFVAKTFLDLGFPPEKLARHQYGFDHHVYNAANRPEVRRAGLTMLFVGGCAPRKGLHFALEAWLRSRASRNGKFRIAGAFVPGYAERLGTMLQHPSVEVLGHRKDVPQLMLDADLLVLPSIEEGSALVTSEARGSGCVLLVSEASGAICEHMTNALVHRVGDVSTLSEHINLMSDDPELLARLKRASIDSVPELTWQSAGKRLYDVYRTTITAFSDAHGLKAKERS